ncbi:MAG TPA: cytochrome c [Candidatus Limnocylindria bacterium]|nr:cytochrome c [Candidatus Limnocylindria bacterium]
MRREVADVVGSGLLLAALVTATIGVMTDRTASASGSSPSTTVSLTDASLVARGRSLFSAKGCVACHTKEQQAIVQVGPALTGLRDRAAERRPGLDAVAYVRESIRTPAAFIVPGYGNAAMPDLALRDEDIDAIAAYLLGTP